MKGKDCVHVCQKIKNIKINCKVDKLMIITKKIANFNVISFTATTTCSVLEFQKLMICHKSRSFNSLQYLHSIEVGIKVQCEDLNGSTFSCLLEFTSFSSSFSSYHLEIPLILILTLYILALQHDQTKNRLC